MNGCESAVLSGFKQGWYFYEGWYFYDCCVVLFGVQNLCPCVGHSVGRSRLTSTHRLKKSHYSSSQVEQFFFFLSHLLMVLGFWKDRVGKNGVLVSHVQLLDAGIQAWTHLPNTVERAWDLWMDTSCLFMAPNPKGCPKPWVWQPPNLLFLFSVPFSLWGPCRSSPYTVISLSWCWPNT